MHFHLGEGSRCGFSRSDSNYLGLSFHVCGKAYNINTLTEFQRNVVKYIAEIGLLKLQQPMNQSWFIPTKLVTNLSDLSSYKQQGIVLVETNFRMYAYTSSRLPMALFRVEYQLPNLINL
ncbi:General transcription and dna repair factor iih subunit tfb2 [Thalictrum thalictroides]|uniref:RNA polymerase II transcription factor B subunit 2 n=1 Tax=Thalictrum thalictroides TaxID=46969 RepID=A0A7J6WRM3_THATH|nr:General transcription and dna repair factor iih subunit tfb2 [Thalictrum thalictroides]